MWRDYLLFYQTPFRNVYFRDHLKMTNQSLRERVQIAEYNYSMASRIIRDATEFELIKDEDTESKSRKYAKYIPFFSYVTIM